MKNSSRLKIARYLVRAMSLVSLLAGLSAFAASPGFDHDATGFPIEDGHRTLDCESCHVNGVFNGLPEAVSAVTNAEHSFQHRPAAPNIFEPPPTVKAATWATYGINRLL